MVEVYDLRKSNLASLHYSLSKINSENILTPINDVDMQCLTFNNILNTHVTCSIPKKQVIITPRDKEWLTSLTKSSIDDRWEACRMRDWQNYNRLKEKVKVKEEIKKSKKLFCEKMN